MERLKKLQKMANLLKLSSIFLLLSFNCFSQSINSPLHHDKQKHIIVGSVIGATSFTLTQNKKYPQQLLIAGGISFGVAYAYELYQGISGAGTVEALDVVYTVGGALVTTGALILTKKLFERKLSKRKRLR
jgi:hypothetical protein